MSQRALAASLDDPAHVVAPRLLGAVVTTAIGGKKVAVRLTEVEAYGGSDDPASHAYRSHTARNAPMWGPPGTVYVYLSYGMHWCANIVTRHAGSASAVLLRGGSVVEGYKVAVERRSRTERLTDGPGKLAQALGLDGSASGTTLWGGPLSITLPFEAVGAFEATPRVGISKATTRMWRFVERGPSEPSSSTIPSR